MTDASCYYCFIRAHYCYILFSMRVYIIVKTAAAAAAADPIIRGENPCLRVPAVPACCITHVDTYV